jgi:putative oxidoreductase
VGQIADNELKAEGSKWQIFCSCVLYWLDVAPASFKIDHSARSKRLSGLSPCTKDKTESKFGASVMALRVIDSMVLRSEPLILLLGRILIGSLYLMSGINHWWDLTLLTHFMTDLPGSVNVWAMLTATIEVVSGVALVLGFRTRDFALLLVLFNLFAAVIGHPYWSITGDATARWAQLISFWKDIGLAGGVLFVLARGAGPWSIDRG